MTELNQPNRPKVAAMDEKNAPEAQAKRIRRRNRRGIDAEPGTVTERPSSTRRSIRCVVACKAEARNIRKRAQIDIASAHKYAIENFSTELLSVMDSLKPRWR